MAVLNNSNAISPSGYDINNSLRLRASASAYLSRTPASAGSRTTWTWSGWVKVGALSTMKGLFERYVSASDFHILGFSSGNVLRFYSFISPTDYGFDTTAVFRDPSAWYHVVAVFDTTNATATDRMRLYVNGVRITAFTDYGSPTLNYVGGWNGATLQTIGRYQDQSGFTDGYLAEVNFIDGQALTPSSFGSTNATTGVWQPAQYTGTYGTNGFYLKFSDIATTSGSNAGLGKDFSGNTNYWTTNNISVTAGTTYDAMTDSPTLTSATVANYAVLNPLVGAGVGGATLTRGNLEYITSVASDMHFESSIAMSSGKWYWEYTVSSGNNIDLHGVCKVGLASTNLAWTQVGTVGYYGNNGQKYVSGVGSAYGASFTSGAVIGTALDKNANTVTFYKNGVSQGTISLPTNEPMVAYFADGSGGGATSGNVNFGQRPFVYTPPTGFVALNTFNLPDSTIKKGNKVMDATTYTGNGTSQTITNAGAFRPDLVWLKSRSAATNNWLADSVRGVTKYLTSNSTAAEVPDGSSITAFNSNGFSLGANTTMNGSAVTYVGWQWQAGQGSTSSNTSGTVTSTVSVNTTAGFSVVTWVSASGNNTVGHGLGVAPKMIIAKNRSITSNWPVYHVSIGGSNIILLDSTSASAANTSYFNGTSPTSTVFSTSTGFGSGNNMVAYCWAEIAGFSKFGSYTGNGSTDGPFVFTNLLPKFIIIKRTDTTGNWIIWDTARNTYNVLGEELYPNLSNAAASSTDLDVLSNGFKLRSTNAAFNASGGTYIFMAFASNPFKNSNAF